MHDAVGLSGHRFLHMFAKMDYWKINKRIKPICSWDLLTINIMPEGWLIFNWQTHIFLKFSSKMCWWCHFADHNYIFLLWFMAIDYYFKVHLYSKQITLVASNIIYILYLAHKTWRAVTKYIWLIKIQLTIHNGYLFLIYSDYPHEKGRR